MVGSKYRSRVALSVTDAQAYGTRYTFTDAINNASLCPSGFKIPSQADFTAADMRSIEYSFNEHILKRPSPGWHNGSNGGANGETTPLWTNEVDPANPTTRSIEVILLEESHSTPFYFASRPITGQNNPIRCIQTTSSTN